MQTTCTMQTFSSIQMFRAVLQSCDVFLLVLHVSRCLHKFQIYICTYYNSGTPSPNWGVINTWKMTTCATCAYEAAFCCATVSSLVGHKDPTASPAKGVLRWNSICFKITWFYAWQPGGQGRPACSPRPTPVAPVLTLSFHLIASRLCEVWIWRWTGGGRISQVPQCQ